MPVRYKVQPGDCMASIAFRHGFHPDALWNDPGNAALREKRASPYVLMAGDEVFIPDRRPREVSVRTGRRHVFRRRAVPEVFQIRFLDRQGEPRAQVDYRFVINGAAREGRTDDDGRLREWIPPDAREAEVILLADGFEESYRVQLGYLDPVTEPSGMKARLNSLGYPCDQTGDTPDEGIRAALRRFQQDHDREPTGEADEATLSLLIERYGS